MKEIITLHIGGAGIAIGSELWSLYSVEHGLDNSGKAICSDENIGSRDILFRENKDGSFSANALFIDLDPSSLQFLKKVDIKSILPSQNIITGKECSANLASRAIYTVGKELMEKIEDAIRKKVEGCDSFEGFFLAKSVAGGTGSGLTDNILTSLSTNYGKKLRTSLTLLPSIKWKDSIVVQSYNAVLGLPRVLSEEDLTIVADNHALYSILSSQLNRETPNYSHINKLISIMTSYLTCNCRLPGNTQINLKEIVNCVVPYPGIHFAVPGYAPYLTKSAQLEDNLTIEKICINAFHPTNLGSSANLRKFRIMSTYLSIRGQEHQKEIFSSLNNLIKKKFVQSVDWVCDPFKIGLTQPCPTYYPEFDLLEAPRAATSFINSMGGGSLVTDINNEFDRLYSKRAFVHWFVGEGMEEGVFSECREDMAALEKDYEEGWGAYVDDAEEGIFPE